MSKKRFTEAELKAHRSARDAARYAANRDAILASRREALEKNRSRINAKRRERYADNPEPAKRAAREWYIKNRESVLRNRSASRAERRAYRRKYERSRRKTDMSFRITKTLRTRLWSAINGVGVSAISALGCSIDEARDHLASQFSKGMSWENYGSGWHIDHIKPLAAFDLTDPAQCAAACHYTNLQPMWAEDNLRKSKRYRPCSDE